MRRSITFDDFDKNEGHNYSKWDTTFMYYTGDVLGYEAPGRYRVHHLSPFRKFFDIITCCLLIYLALVLPIEVGIGVENDVLVMILVIIDFWFITDVILNFFTTYEDPSLQTVCEFKLIWKHYLQGWFFVDLISSIPFTDEMFTNHQTGASLKAAKLLKLVKLLRVLRLGRLIHRFQRQFQVKHGAILIFKFSCVIWVFAHWIGCIWYLFSSLFLEWLDNWTNQYPDTDNPIKDFEPFSIYTVMLYWSTQTMVTVGYGDVLPVTSENTVFVLICMMAAGGIFAYGLSNICSIIYNMNVTMILFRKRQDGLMDWTAHSLRGTSKRKIMLTKLEGYIGFKFENSHVDVFEPEPYMEFMSADQRLTTLDLIFQASFPIDAWGGSIVGEDIFGHKMSTNLRFSIASCIKGQMYHPHDTFIVGKLEPHMWFLLSGVVTVRIEGQTQRKRLDWGAVWGEYSTLFCRSFTNYVVTAERFCDVYSVSKSALDENVWPNNRRVEESLRIAWEQWIEAVKKENAGMDVHLMPGIAEDDEYSFGSIEDNVEHRRNVSPKMGGELSKKPSMMPRASAVFSGAGAYDKKIELMFRRDFLHGSDLDLHRDLLRKVLLKPRAVQRSLQARTQATTLAQATSQTGLNKHCLKAIKMMMIQHASLRTELVEQMAKVYKVNAHLTRRTGALGNTIESYVDATHNQIKQALSKKRERKKARARARARSLSVVYVDDEEAEYTYPGEPNTAYDPELHLCR